MAENDENLNSDNDVFYALLCRTIPNTYNNIHFFFALLYSVSDLCDLGGEISVPESLPRFGYFVLDSENIYSRLWSTTRSSNCDLASAPKLCTSSIE